MDQDLDYSELIEKQPKHKKESYGSAGGARPLRLILIILLLLVLLGAGGYALYTRPDLLQSLAQLLPAAAGQEQAATATPEPPQPTATLAATAASEVTLTPSQAAATEVPVESAPAALLSLPENAVLLQSSAAPGDQETRAIQLAKTTAVREPYYWEYIEFQPGMLVKDAERYYIGLLYKEMHFSMYFNEKYPKSALGIFKFKQDTRRVTIQFFEGSGEQAPVAFVFYENW